MISLTVTTSGPDQAASAAAKLQNPAGIHARMAGAMERFLKDFGAETSRTEHATANRLGARPTGHLTDAYARVESSSGPAAASLWVPGASRLRAAFGAYTVTPTPPRRFLTIPVNAAAYGRRAREFPKGELFVLSQGVKSENTKPFLVLARSVGQNRVEAMYLLVRSATIQEDTGLIPFDDLYAEGADAARDYLLEEEATP